MTKLRTTLSAILTRIAPGERTRGAMIMTGLLGAYFALPIGYAVWAFAQN